MSEPAALDLALANHALKHEGITVAYSPAVAKEAREIVALLVDASERCRAERDALCVALERIRDFSYLAGEGLPRAIALEALGEVTQ